MNAPLVSVLLPTRNRDSLLSRAIASVLSQTYPNFELIVVDDGSTDETETVVKGFSDERIRYVYQDHRGAAAAENLGTRLARGSFIAFIDDDDEWLCEKLEKQMERFALEGEDTAVVYTAAQFFKNGKHRFYGPPQSILVKNGSIYREILNRTTYVPLVCAVVRRECLEEVGGFDETMPTSNDYDLWIRLSSRYRFQYLPEPLVHVHYTAGSMSTTPTNTIVARKLLLEKHRRVFAKPEGRGIGAFFYWQIGYLLLLQGERREGRRYLFLAARHAPWKLSYTVGALLSLFGRGMLFNRLLQTTVDGLRVRWKRRLFQGG
jgi:glycosyltransferase involved in cell wall biosynthesis